MLFIAIALFGALAYAFAQSTRSSAALIAGEASKAGAVGLADCKNAVTLAQKRLAVRNCGALISMEPDGSAITGGPADGTCSIFHTNGGGVKLCGEHDGSCMPKLAIGESCNGVTFTGVSGGNRLYTTSGMQAAATWNNGVGPDSVTPGSEDNGFQNTTDLVNDTGNAAGPFNAAIMCRALGKKWYLPSIEELSVMYDNRNIGDLAGTYVTAGGNLSIYWSSTEKDAATAKHIRFQDGDSAHGNKSSEYKIRCARQD